MDTNNPFRPILFFTSCRPLCRGGSVDEMREDRRLSRPSYVSMTFIVSILALMLTIKEIFYVLGKQSLNYSNYSEEHLEIRKKKGNICLCSFWSYMWLNFLFSKRKKSSRCWLDFKLQFTLIYSSVYSTVFGTWQGLNKYLQSFTEFWNLDSFI